MWNLKEKTNEFISKTERDSDTENKLTVTRGEGIVREFGINMYPLLYLKWITEKDLLYSTGNSAQYYVTI